MSASDGNRTPERLPGAVGRSPLGAGPGGLSGDPLSP